MVYLFLGLCLLTPGLFCQEGETAGEERQRETIPNVLRRPGRAGESPRFPQDLVIGEIGKGEASDEAWLLARNLLTALTAGNAEDPALRGTGNIITESLREEINSIEPRTFRLGSGRTEANGCISFLVRFLGSMESITGELFLRLDDDPEFSSRWLLDDLIIEEKRTLSEIRDSYRFDFSPYERFY